MRNILLVLLVLWLCSCARYHAETRRRVAEAEIMEACAQGQPCPVTISITRKYGEVPEFQVMPPVPFIGVLSATVHGD